MGHWNQEGLDRLTAAFIASKSPVAEGEKKGGKGEWYRTGLEAFCKTVAAESGLSQNIEGWSEIIIELFGADNARLVRKDSISRTWTLGAAKRRSTFAKAWPSAQGRSSLDACLHSLCASMTDESSLEKSYILSVFLESKVDALDGILESVTQGLKTEGWPDDEVAGFATGAYDEISKLATPQDAEGEFAYDAELLAKAFVAAVIYGPAHPDARFARSEGTSLDDEPALSTPFDCFYDSIVFTHHYADDFAALGTSRRCKKSEVVYFGVSTDKEAYCFRLKECLDACGIKIDAESEAVIRIPKPCDHVSDYHAAAFYYQDQWYCVDLGSRHGTAIVPRGGGVRLLGAFAPSVISPGDCIWLATMCDEMGFYSYERNAAIMASVPVGVAEVV